MRCFRLAAVLAAVARRPSPVARRRDDDDDDDDAVFGNKKKATAGWLAPRVGVCRSLPGAMFWGVGSFARSSYNSRKRRPLRHTAAVDDR